MDEKARKTIQRIDEAEDPEGVKEALADSDLSGTAAIVATAAALRRMLRGLTDVMEAKLAEAESFEDRQLFAEVMLNGLETLSADFSEVGHRLVEAYDFGDKVFANWPHLVSGKTPGLGALFHKRTIEEFFEAVWKLRDPARRREVAEKALDEVERAIEFHGRMGAEMVFQPAVAKELPDASTRWPLIFAAAEAAEARRAEEGESDSAQLLDVASDLFAVCLKDDEKRKR